MKGKRSRRQFSSEENATILRRHLVDEIPVLEFCEGHDSRPTLLYLWQRQALENLSAALENRGRDRRSGPEEALARTVEQLKTEVSARDARLARRDRVIAEVTARRLRRESELEEP